MALIEEMDRSGNWLFRWRSFLPLLLFFGAVPVVLLGRCVMGRRCRPSPDGAWVWPLVCLAVGMAGQKVRGLVRRVYAAGHFGSQHQGGAGRGVTQHDTACIPCAATRCISAIC